MPHDNHPTTPPGRLTADVTVRNPASTGARWGGLSVPVQHTHTRAALRSHPTGSTHPLRAPIPTTEISAQRAARNVASLRATAWHLDPYTSSVPVTFTLAQIIPPRPPQPTNKHIIYLASTRILLSVPEPPPDSDASVASRASKRPQQAQTLVNAVGVKYSNRLFPLLGNILIPAPGSCAVILEFSLSNCPKSEADVQRLMGRQAIKRDMTSPRFIAVDSFFTWAFLLFCHAEDSPIILTLIFLLNSLYNGVQVLTEDITTLAKARNNSNGAGLFGPALFVALRRTQSLANRIGATVTAPRSIGK